MADILKPINNGLFTLAEANQMRTGCHDDKLKCKMCSPSLSYRLHKII